MGCKLMTLRLINIIMRYNHSYISLMVDGMLPGDVANKWRETVRILSPNGTVSSATIMVDGSPKESDLYVVRKGNATCYVVPLSRDLLEDEAGKIAIAWSRLWDDGDFEITFRQPESSRQRKQEQVAAVLDQLAENIAKLLHAKWLHGKAEHHWSYSPRYSPAQKQHPMMLPWEQLPAKHKRSEIERTRDTLEILDSINLKIARK